jgi:hypothetical protein
MITSSTAVATGATTAALKKGNEMEARGTTSTRVWKHSLISFFVFFSLGWCCCGTVLDQQIKRGGAQTSSSLLSLKTTSTTTQKTPPKEIG